MIPDEAVEAAVESVLKDDQSFCECRHSPLDKHDVNPPCSTRKRVTGQMVIALESAIPFLAEAAKQPQRNSPTDWPDIPKASAALKEAEDHQ